MQMTGTPRTYIVESADNTHTIHKDGCPDLATDARHTRLVSTNPEILVGFFARREGVDRAAVTVAGCVH